MEINRKSLDKKQRIKEEIKSIIALCRDKDVLIYGAGQRGKALYRFLQDIIFLYAFTCRSSKA